MIIRFINFIIFLSFLSLNTRAQNSEPQFYIYSNYNEYVPADSMPDTCLIVYYGPKNCVPCFQAISDFIYDYELFNIIKLVGIIQCDSSNTHKLLGKAVLQLEDKWNPSYYYDYIRRNGDSSFVNPKSITAQFQITQAPILMVKKGDDYIIFPYETVFYEKKVNSSIILPYIY